MLNTLSTRTIISGQISTQLTYTINSSDGGVAISPLPEGTTITVNSNIVITNMVNKASLVIEKEELEPTNNPFIFRVNSEAAKSYGVKNIAFYYSKENLANGPSIIYNVSESADTEALGSIININENV